MTVILIPFVVYPIFFLAIWTSLSSVAWRIFWSLLFVPCLFFPPANIVYPVIMIIGVPVFVKLREINQRF